MNSVGGTNFNSAFTTVQQAAAAESCDFTSSSPGLVQDPTKDQSTRSQGSRKPSLIRGVRSRRETNLSMLVSVDSPLTFISIKSGRAEGHTCVHLLVVIEPTATRQALCWAPARACLTSLMTSTAASCCCVPKVAQGALAHTLPVGARAGEDLCFIPTLCPPCVVLTWAEASS